MTDLISSHELNRDPGSRGRGDIPVTIVIPVKNEEKNLPRCLAALSRFSEVVVVDSASTDNTPHIAHAWGATVVPFVWNGRYPKKRNWVLSTFAFRNDWIIFLDADEVVRSDFCSEIIDALRSDKYNGYWLNYTNYFLGRQLNHGVRQRKLAMIRRGFALYERIEEDRWSTLDMEVHEHPIVDGPVGEISSPIDHRDFRGLETFLARHIEYAAWEARRYASLRTADPSYLDRLTPRQRFKYTHIGKWWYAPFYFFASYIVRLGLLDGSAGFSYCLYKAWYFYTVRQLIRATAE